MSEPLSDLAARLEAAAAGLRSGEVDTEEALRLIEECAKLAADASQAVEQASRAAVEPLPHLPGQLPLPAGS